MKRAGMIILLALLLAMAATPALATADDNLPDAYSWEAVGTVGGCMAVTLLIVQLVKAPVEKFLKMPTRVFVYIISLTLMVCANIFTGKITGAGDVALLACNAIPVALSAMGAYELTFAKHDDIAEKEKLEIEWLNMMKNDKPPEDDDEERG